MRRSCDRQDGFATPELLLASALAMVLLAMCANLLVQQYALAAVRAALDEGVRAGTLVGADGGDCTARARAALDGLLRGRAGRSIQVACVRRGSGVAATARVRVDGWAPLVPHLERVLRAEAVAEP